jgi:hypothetical protein
MPTPQENFGAFDMLGRVRESHYSLHFKQKIKMLSRTTDD